jgi:hypothetical protein
LPCVNGAPLSDDRVYGWEDFALEDYDLISAFHDIYKNKNQRERALANHLNPVRFNEARGTRRSHPSPTREQFIHKFRKEGLGRIRKPLPDTPAVSAHEVNEAAGITMASDLFKVFVAMGWLKPADRAGWYEAESAKKMLEELTGFEVRVSIRPRALSMS